MIQFKDTFEQNGIVNFLVDSGDIAKTYPLEELEKFVIDNALNISYEHDREYSGYGDIRNPANWDSIEREVHELPSDWLDDQDNFLMATEKFYIAKNQHEFKSVNREQETIRRVS